MQQFVIELDNARAMHALFAGDEKLLREVEDRFAVRITTRDAWLRVEGDDAAVGRARTVFEQLDAARKQGVAIRREDFQLVVRAVAEGRPSELGRLADIRIQCAKNKPVVMPRTAGQKDYVQAIRNHDVTFGIGPAGTGKTYLAVALAVSCLKQEKVSRIVLTRPAVEAGEALGFLPGDLQEKILPYLRPLYDALYDMLEVEETQKLMDRGIIEIAPLAYMRGRTLGSSFVILDEAQNTTTEQMFMFLTRLGPGSKCVVTGDRTQIDLPKNKRSGLIEAAEALEGVAGIAFQHFQDSDVVRHPLVQSIIRAYQQHRGLQDSRI